MLLMLFPLSAAALPQRLVLLLDGVAYRDMKALQGGILCTNGSRQIYRRAFDRGYFPVSRNISTFPSTSDVAWTEILGDRPLPGYQRTYFSGAADTEIFQNGVTTTMEFEKQMHWQLTSAFYRAMGYVHPGPVFRHELNALADAFLNATNVAGNYYAMIRTTDDAQHMSGDIFDMLCALDARLQELRDQYKMVEGHDLDVLILSDHGNNHAGAGKRVDVRSFLEKEGYRPGEIIREPKDVVLPTAGIESWVEIHNAPAETQRLLTALSQLEGVDIVTACVPDQTNKFIIVDSKGRRALIEWQPESGRFRYAPETGDPLDYRMVIEELATKNKLDEEGFATADDWMAETVSHHYPLALERIARAHTRVTLNPATILISLKSGYVHAGWLVKTASGLMTSGGTHGALDDDNSDGIVLSSFSTTQDTSSSRIAGLFGGFTGLRDYRAEEAGAEWFSGKAQAMTMIKRNHLDDAEHCPLPDGLFLRVWAPALARCDVGTPLEIALEKTSPYPGPSARGGSAPDIRHVTLDQPPLFHSECERLYAVPAGLALEPQRVYKISGWTREDRLPLFAFSFRTDALGKPVAY
jgi:Type I phosphodiesterase / nucleotide pyrophosphatase